MSLGRGEGNLFSPSLEDSLSPITDRVDSGYGDSLMDGVENVTVEKPDLESSNEEKVPVKQQSRTARQRRAGIDQNRNSQHETASVNSVSSVPSSMSSRRDSAVSSSSRPHCRTKLARSTSYQPSKGSLPYSSIKTGPAPSRPCPRRIISSPHIQDSRTNIEQALALHERSCRIFGTTSRPSTSNGVSTTAAEPAPPMLRRATAANGSVGNITGPFPPMRSYTEPDGIPKHDFTDKERQYDNFVPATIIDWTSAETRREQYSKIDKSNKGVRGLLKKLFPKLVTRSSESRFYDEKEGSSAGSVRRFRLDLPEDEVVHNRKK